MNFCADGARKLEMMLEADNEKADINCRTYIFSSFTFLNTILLPAFKQR